MQIVARWIGHTCIILGSCKWWTFTSGILLLDIFTTWCLVSHLTFSFLVFSSFFFQAAETPKPRDVESPKDSGVRKRKGGQANVDGQVNANSFLSLILDWLSSWIDSHPGLTLILYWLSSWIDSHPGLTLILDWLSSWIDSQGGRDPYLTVASMDSALSHSLASEDSDNDLLEQRWPVTESWKEPLIFQQ